MTTAKRTTKSRRKPDVVRHQHVFSRTCTDEVHGRFDAIEDADGRICVLDVGGDRILLRCGSRKEAIAVAKAAARAYDEISVRAEDIPVRLLRRFCSEQKLGIRHLSTSTKAVLLEALSRRGRIDELRVWLATRGRELGYEVESLPSGRRITRTYSDGFKRVYEERK